MKNNYDRIDLLNQALEFRGKSADWLTDQLGISIIDLHGDLTGEHAPVHIRRISELLEIPEASFWNGFRIEGGHLVPNAD